MAWPCWPSRSPSSPRCTRRGWPSACPVDVDPDAFELARAYFGLAPEVDCHVDDARAFLERTTTQFDAIVVDSFFRNALPDHLCSTEFFVLVRSRLTRGGMLLFNAVVAHDLDRIADRLAAGMAEAGLATRILETPGERDRNAIVLGGPVARLLRPTLLVAPDTRLESLVAELGAMTFRERRQADPIRDPIPSSRVLLPVGEKAAKPPGPEP